MKMSGSDSNDGYSSYSNVDQRLTRVLSPDEVLYIEKEQIDDETITDQSPSRSEDVMFNKIKGAKEEQVRELIHKMNIHKDDLTQEEAFEEEEIKDSNVEEEPVAKNAKKNVANKKPAKEKAKKNKQVQAKMEQSEDETTFPTVVEMPSEEGISSKKSKKGKTKDIDTDVTTSNIKSNKRLTYVVYKENYDNTEDHSENQSDSEINKKENENNSADTMNIPENNEKVKKTSKKTKPNENIKGGESKIPLIIQNGEENNDTKGKPDKSLKKVVREPNTTVTKKEAIVKNTEFTSTRLTRAQTRNAMVVIQENNDPVEKYSAINNTNDEPAKVQRKKNLKKNGKQTNENVVPEADVTKDVEQESKKKQNSVKEKTAEKQNNVSSVPKTKQTKSKAQVLQEKKGNGVEVATKRAARKK